MKRLVFAFLCLAGMCVAAHAYSQGEKDAFLKADANKDRKITKSEFRTLIEALAQAGAPKAMSVKKWGVYSYAFKRIDANADGVITPPELEAQR